MLDHDDLDKQERSTCLGSMSRSGSGGSLPGEKPTNGLSRSGSASSLTSPVAKAPDAPNSRAGGLRFSQYQRQSQDLTSSPKPTKGCLDAAVQSVREEMKLLMAQHQLSCHHEISRSLEPVHEELKRLAGQVVATQGHAFRDGAGPSLTDQLIAVQDKLARNTSALGLLTERVDQKHKSLEDRIEDEMTEVTKAMTQLSEEGQKPAKLAEDAAVGLERLRHEFKTWKEHSQEVASWEIQDRIDDHFNKVKEELVGFKDHFVKTSTQAEGAVLAFEGIRAEVTDLRLLVDKLAAQTPSSAQAASSSPAPACSDGELQQLRQEVDRLAADSQKRSQEASAYVEWALEEHGRTLQQEFRNAAEVGEEAKRLAAATNLHTRSQLATLQEGLMRVAEQAGLTSEGQRCCESPGGPEREVSTEAEPVKQILSLQDRFEGEIREVKKGLARVKKHVKRNTPELGEDVLREHDTVHEDLRMLKQSTGDLAQQAQRMQEDFVAATGFMREELGRLGELIAASPGKATATPAASEGPPPSNARLPGACGRSPSRNLEGALASACEPGTESGALDQEDIVRTMASVRKELLRAKDLFHSGQKSAGVVMSDVEALKQDFQALKESYPTLGEESMEILRLSLRQELADEFKKLAQVLLPKRPKATE